MLRDHVPPFGVEIDVDLCPHPPDIVDEDQTYPIGLGFVQPSGSSVELVRGDVGQLADDDGNQYAVAVYDAHIGGYCCIGPEKLDVLLQRIP